jgi:hypothetical protein
MNDQVKHAAALRRRVFRVADHIQVQPPPLPEQHALALPPGYDRAEQTAPHLLRGQLPLPADGEDDAADVPEPEEPLVHGANAKRTAGRRLPGEALETRHDQLG